ncbi:beta-galactosidase [Cohaesibacter sp. CAU 1516]|uniref:beta-galactosidase n=1 Tax=Cohaesibacter sp. CAU 1516 TaxID=2576038 RepID=UPI0010FF50BC|nr:beta-galactosidase [Cohaesibacter sp. CAU 1516]TLP48572.1 beta-galactosidase [Cohaesibacter sp. CAU 1516]
MTKSIEGLKAFQRSLGVCYYPEQWDRSVWQEDARRMVEAGIKWVRIGEFAWSRLEPQPDKMVWDWLDDAIEILGAAGLKVVLGTPSATPPRWMIDCYPDMLAVDEKGQPRKFGSRRHYCFSHAGYRREAVRMARLMGERYGRNPHVAAWQIDNEYGCHDTILSYSNAAQVGFRDWLSQLYGSIAVLNEAWGNVFWSMDYDSFKQIELPNMTVTEPNPSHVMAFRRFSSDQVVRFNKEQADALRELTDAPLIHNYMGRVTEFDHYDVGLDLDIASWDSYPIGFLSDRLEESEDHKLRFLRQGDPDFQAFHHDLYRAVGKSRWWVMEQQPGPVNWAPFNPAPLDGMVRLWSWEAFAHGAEVVSYFRWRQAPFAQEQMHTALLRPDDVEARGLLEARQVAAEIAADEALQAPAIVQAPVALIFDYPSQWAWDTQPQGADFDYFRLVFETYRALRALGLSVDILPKRGNLTGYKLILAPGLMTLEGLALSSTDATVILGPRSGVKTEELTFPMPLGPNLVGLDCTVSLTQSLPPSVAVPLDIGGHGGRWLESLEGDFEVVAKTQSGEAVLVKNGGKWHYLSIWPDADAWRAILTPLCAAEGIETVALPDGVRLRDTANHRFVFNYNSEPVEWGGETIPAAGVSWKKR